MNLKKKKNPKKHTIMNHESCLIVVLRESPCHCCKGFMDLHHHHHSSSSSSSSWMDFMVGMTKPAASTAAVLMAVILSYNQKLSLEGEMLHATVRSFLQLSIVGFVLHFIFAQDSTGWTLLAYFFMVTVAGYTAGQRSRQVPQGKYIAGISILIGSASTMVLPLIFRVLPFTPQYFIPVGGMMVGHAMAVTGVTMKKLHQELKLHKNLVETALALGATPRQATLQQVKRSLVLALSPDLDSVKTVGLITLPGTMTGLIMGGATPLEAIQLQMVVTSMLVGSCVMSSILSTYLCLHVYFTKSYQVKERALEVAE